jgi:hypothetical protein
MPRYEGMTDLLRHVRERLVDESAPTEPTAAESRPSLDVLRQDGQYERIVASAQTLMREAELLRELLGAEHVHTLSAAQHEHVLSVLNSVMQELWSSEVTLRRARLHD